ncbi:MAG: fumarylacetoacetate hydrolase family protein [Bacteroidia bacterium]|nr:fumarylacetoacetate hydrolase family protein [Bacteroidia bacterium]MCX7763857.1 fumarylacetoacetate hydrolase family protein [Bacteroidia bacterium]MDW8057708.1 fumarylacetoacetate hydrolase family protein [Bacteroidia bacterium]
MKFVRFLWQGQELLGIMDTSEQFVLSLNIVGQVLGRRFPFRDIESYLQARLEWEGWVEWVKRRYHERGDFEDLQVPYAAVRVLSPVRRPVSLRDGYAFRQHVEAARRNRGLEMIPEFDQFPVFYFSNTLAVTGPGPIYVEPRHLEKLDFELEVAIILGRSGRNIPAHAADEYIFGYMLMNDWSARALQMEEMKLNLGPAKGKDFATSLGPWVVTPDELEPYRTEPPSGHIGRAYRLALQAEVNQQPVSYGFLSDMSWTFAEIIERVSYGVEVFPGEVIGSGTVGTGCFLEINGTRRRETPNAPETWLQIGDEVALTGTELGTLRNTIHPA